MRTGISLLALLLAACGGGNKGEPDVVDVGDEDLADSTAETDVQPDTEPDTATDPGPDLPPITGTWITIDPGAFQMGSPEAEPDRFVDETQHPVTLGRGFEMLSTEVTQAQFEERMGYNPSNFSACGDDCPVETVNWHEAAAYCNALSAAAGLDPCYSCSGTGNSVICTASTAHSDPYGCPGYRLPTEAEWEYAARAGTTGGTYNGTCPDETACDSLPNPVLEPIAWFCGNSGDITHTVATLDPNPWGLYDMLGNVWEWCGDWYGDYPSGSVTDPIGPSTGSERVMRGGSAGGDIGLPRAAYRSYRSPMHWREFFGFRPVRSL